MMKIGSALNQWTKVHLGDVAEVFNGKTPSKKEQRDNGYPILKIKDINEGGYFIGSFDSFVDDDFYNKYKTKKLKNGDTLILNAAHSATHVGTKKAYVDFIREEDVIPTGEWTIVRSKSNELDNKFKDFLLKSDGFSHVISKLVRGIHLYPKDLASLNIILPPLAAQEKIISILEKVEETKRLREDAAAKTNDYARSIFLEMFGDPVINPKKWKPLKFSEIGTLARGKSKHRPRNAPELLGGPYPLIQTGDVANSGGYIREYNQTYSEIGLNQSKMWPAGTLCITIAANIAKTGILTFDACFPDSIVGFTPNEKVRTEYVQYWLSFLQEIIEKKAPESAQKNINLKILSNLDVPLPPIELQEKFSKIVGDIEEIKESQEESRKEIQDLFDALMQKAFTGKLVA